MSMSGSLMGYENNNDVHQAAKCKRPLKSLPVVTSVNAAGVTSTSSSLNGGVAGSRLNRLGRNIKYPPTSPTHPASSASNRRRGVCGRGHVNSLWSVWYGIIAVSFQAYIASRCIRRFIAFLSLPWPADAPPPKVELHVCLALAGTGILLLPILLAAAFLKLGNLANDGIKLGRHISTCSRDPPSALLNSNTDSGGLANNLWRHGGPTAAFVHLCTAMCFLLPSLLMEARLIHAGFLPKDAIWRTDLDWVVVHRDRLVVLSFMNIPENLNLSLGAPSYYSTSQPYLEDELDDIMNSSSSSSEEASPLTTGYSSILTTLSSSATSGGSGLPSSTLDSTSSFSSSSETETDADLLSSISRQPTASSSSTTAPPSSSTAARRPTSRMNARNVPRNRPKSKKNWSSAKAKQSQARAGNMSAQYLPLSFSSLADLDRPESYSDETSEDYGPITLEYLNYAMALGVYSVRYPAVFWSTNKALGTIFSIQLVANAAQSLLAYAGMSVLYKVQVVGPLKALPLILRQRSLSTASTLSNLLGDRFFLLNPHVTLGLFALSSLLVVICSSMVMYLYAYGRYTLFLNQERERRVIMSKESRSEDTSWTYMTHPAALCVFLAIGICAAPLLYDYSVVYRGSLDGAVLACIVGTMLHLGLFLFLWILLAFKKRWTFKVRVTIGRATVRSSRSLKLVTDVDLMSAGARDEDDASAAPLLVVGNGRTYTVAETSPKKAIMGVIQKAAMDRKARSQGSTIDSMDGDSTADGDEQIYWLRPKLRSSPMQAGGGAAPGAGNQPNDKGWLNKKLKQKVTFNDLPSTSGSRNKGKGRRGVADGGPEDDGDYATLRELPLVTAHELNDDTTSEENKLLECVNDDQVTYYASGNRDLHPSEGEPSPLLSPDQPLPDPPPPACQLADVGLPLPLPPPTPTSQEIVNGPIVHSANPQLSSGQTPRCLRRADSGMPHEELTPRSDSSHSPPLDGLTNGTVVVSGVNGVMNGPSHNGSSTTSSHNSESASSSGVHSNGSNASNASSSHRRATSVEDLATGEPREEAHWRSCSLQRGTQPPGATTAGSSSSASTSSAGSSSSPAKFSNPGRVITNPTANYAPAAAYPAALYNGELAAAAAVGGPGCPALILESEATVVIRRKNSRTKLQEPPTLSEEPFGRSTNMRMTSFTENNDLRAIQASSATLPHYPTQPVVTYPHCSTMPLPHASSHSSGVPTSMSGSSGSCGSVPRHPGNLGPGQQPSVNHGSVPSHTTLPSHHNGVRLMLHNGPNPFVKRFPPVHMGPAPGQPWPVLTGSNGPASSLHHHAHHTFPQALQLNGKLLAPNGMSQQQQLGQPHARHSDRDSANFSMASSGDSDTCLPH